MKGRTIAFLHCEEFRSVRYSYLIHLLGAIWRENGATVVDLYGDR